MLGAREVETQSQHSVPLELPLANVVSFHVAMVGKLLV